MIFSTLSVLLLVGQLVSAMPFEQVTRNLPRDVVHIAHDEANGQYVAYKRDGSLYGRYPADPTRNFDNRKREDPGCVKLGIEEAKKLPGFKLIEEFANREIGTGKRNVVTNPTDADQVAQGAVACVSKDAVQVEFSGTPICKSTSEVDGAAEDANGSITSGISSAYSNKGSWTVTSISSLGASARGSAMFKIPEIAELGGEIAARGEFTNDVGRSFETKNEDTATSKATFNVPSDQKCQIGFDKKTCTVSGKGKVRYEASGFIWFEYESKVKDHFKWAVSIEDTIKNVDDRSSFMEFTGSIEGTANANIAVKCAPK